MELCLRLVVQDLISIYALTLIRFIIDHFLRDLNKMQEEMLSKSYRRQLSCLVMPIGRSPCRSKML